MRPESLVNPLKPAKEIYLASFNPLSGSRTLLRRPASLVENLRRIPPNCWQPVCYQCVGHAGTPLKRGRPGPSPSSFGRVRADRLGPLLATGGRQSEKNSPGIANPGCQQVGQPRSGVRRPILMDRPTAPQWSDRNATRPGAIAGGFRGRRIPHCSTGPAYRRYLVAISGRFPGKPLWTTGRSD